MAETLADTKKVETSKTVFLDVTPRSTKNDFYFKQTQELHRTNWGKTPYWDENEANGTYRSGSQKDKSFHVMSAVRNDAVVAGLNYWDLSGSFVYESYGSVNKEKGGKPEDLAGLYPKGRAVVCEVAENERRLKDATGFRELVLPTPYLQPCTDESGQPATGLTLMIKGKDQMTKAEVLTLVRDVISKYFEGDLKKAQEFMDTNMPGLKDLPNVMKLKPRPFTN